MPSQLLHIVRTVIRADSDPARQALFANLTQARLPVRFACALHARLRDRWGSTFVIGGYGLIAYLRVASARPRGVRVLAVAQHENARRQVARVFEWLGPAECGMVRSDLGTLATPSALVRLAALVRHGRVRRVLRLARAIDRRHGLLVATRVIGAIAWYARTRTILREDRPGAVLVSSDSNPEELGLVAAARTLDIPQVFVSHAYPTPFSPPLDFTLSILEGEAAVEARQRKGPIRGRILLAGIEGDSVPLDPQRLSRRAPVIGIFTPKAVSWPTLATLVNDCRRHLGASRVVIRWHPSMLQRPRLADWVTDRSGIVESSRALPIAEVARQCDWVIADVNSNVHLEVLKLGIPTVAIMDLGLYPASHSDMYGFVANGIVFPSVTSIREIQPEAFRAFFGDGWSRRFERYDVSYLRSGNDIGREVRCAIQALIDDPRSTAAPA